ncbi:hypothetical protein [Nocardia camponoti]|uniref:Uncharacterized protein n=1 Tax=Nocardia camponoti TaxID=1616106 RepID=A0A917QFY5_9NOCA|nr:hypothetical protein [Nocardia camponoti]GGK47082.1 hypothetical protein GCM10011591_17980 [Nocardia camponoti]
MGNDLGAVGELLCMSLKYKAAQRLSVLAGVVGAVAAAFVGPAQAVPSDQVVQFNPTLVRVPGQGCAAIVNAETVPQPQVGVFGVKVRITQTGSGCDAWRVAVRWKNLDSGITNGQSAKVVNGVVEAPDSVIVGFGTGPGAGRVEAEIVATADLYPSNPELDQLSGKAWFTLNK